MQPKLRPFKTSGDETFSEAGKAVPFASPTTKFLVRDQDSRWLPSAISRRQDGRQGSFTRPVQPHDQINRTVRGGKPVRFLVGRRFVLLHVNGERTVRVLLKRRQHGRVN